MGVVEIDTGICIKLYGALQNFARETAHVVNYLDGL